MSFYPIISTLGAECRPVVSIVQPIHVIYETSTSMPPRLIDPPPAIGPRAAAPSNVVVPGGPVYNLPPWWPNWLRLKPVPIPSPKPPPTPSPVPQTPHPDAEEVVAALDRERARRGLAPLVYAADISGVAQYWSDYQALHRTMIHGSFSTRIWSVRPGTWVAENVAEGYPDVASVVAGWMGSPGHRANILGNYTAAGVGISQSSDGTKYWTLDLVR